MWFDLGGSSDKTKMPTKEEALKGRSEVMPVTDKHYVNGRQLLPPFPEGMEEVVFGMGCFWGAERIFWQLDGVYTTAVGYSGGYTQNPLYDEVCRGKTGHTEVVLVVFDPEQISFATLLKQFWEAHDPTQGMRQGNDVGTQYRSAVYCTTEQQLQEARASRDKFASQLQSEGLGEITTEVEKAGPFYYAEDYHQQYLGKKPYGYCGLKGLGVSCPVA